MHCLQSADEVLIRPLERSGEFELVVGLRESPSLETLRRLASQTDRLRLIELALSLSLPLPESSSSKDMLGMGPGLSTT